MGGGLMQLVAYGAQDVYLTGQPQITFFKVVYRRHTNFSVEPVEQVFNGSAGDNKTLTCNLARNGDLVTNMYFVITLGAVESASVAVSSWISKVKIEIGGSKIDEQTGAWMELWHGLTKKADSETAYKSMTDGTTAHNADKLVYIPFNFWFCRNPGLALPLIALQYHDVRVTVETGAGGSQSVSDMKLVVDYVYLDSEERKRFAQASHEYLIEQVQDSGSETQTSGSSKKIRLNFNHPCKFIAWRQNTATTKTTEAKLSLNGHDRLASRSGSYFQNVQAYQHFTNTPESTDYVYSFALNPEEHQPSGTCNFSRIDNATLHLTADAATTVNVYAMNYNVLRIMSGMGGLAYSN